MRSFVIWLGGIVATVVGGLLVYHFTTPRTNTFEGMVIDGAQSVPIKEARVVFAIEPSSPGNGPYNDFTDENGSYRMDLSQLPRTVKVTMHATAKGFRDSNPVSLAPPFTLISQTTDNRTDFVLEPLPTQVTAHPVATPAPTPVVGHIKLQYVPKAFTRNITFQASGK